MPTRNRRRFVSQAIRCFLRQDYPHKKLIVLDDGDDRVADLIPADERIHYEYCNRRRSIGTKRNLACELTAAELIVHWDDDDWASPCRLRLQVDALLSNDVDVCGLRQLLYYKPDTHEAWLYSHPAARRWLAGCTLMYRRSTWKRTPFPDWDTGEDAAFVGQQPVERITALAETSWFIGLIHSGNTGAKRLTDPHWQRRPVAELSALYEFDADFYRLPQDKTGASRSVSANHGAKTARPETVCAESVGLPMVSCVVPTHNRRQFLPRAIEYFRRQSYSNRELIVVDDGTDPVRDLIPADPSIRYVRVPHRSSTGAKRNIGCEMARGNIVMLWDDDDWYGTDRIAYQVEPLIARRADVTGLGNSMIYHAPTRRFWACTPRLHSRMFYAGVVGGTLAFRKQLWGKHRFPDLSEREDAAFLETLIRRGARLEQLPNNGVFIYVRHGSNTWQFMPGNFLKREEWREVAPPSFLPDSDRRFYDLETEIPRGPSRPEQPLVSCILATTPGNRRFLAQSVQYTLRQTYSNKEIIVVDDQPRSAEHLIPANDRIQYVRLPRRASLGAKLNAGIRRSKGEIIQKLDVDDYYHPKFLETTVGALIHQDPERSIAGFDSFLVLVARTLELKFSGHGWFAGGTLCFHRRQWAAAPFRNLHHAVDWYFLQDHAVSRISLQHPELYIMVRHGGDHVWNKMGDTDVTEYFERQPNYSKSLSDCLPAADLSFYESLRFSAVEREFTANLNKTSITPLGGFRPPLRKEGGLHAS